MGRDLGARGLIVRWPVRVVALAVLLFSVVALDRPEQASATSPKHIQTVFVIMMENHNWSTIFRDSKHAPYIHSLVMGANDTSTSYMNDYYNPPQNHPSLPNYLWLEGGQCYTYCGTDNDPSPSPNGISGTHLTTLLDAANISWKAYEENDPGGCPMSDSGEYAPRHDPFVYFNDVNGNTQYCSTHIVDYSTLARDLANNTVARYNFITPNLCDDMHDPCAPLNNPIAQGDAWLAANVPAIEAWVMAHSGALFITWDEAANGDGPVGMIAISPFAKGHGYDVKRPRQGYAYTHSSLLKSLEEIYGVSPLLGDAGNRNTKDLSTLFTAFP